MPNSQDRWDAAERDYKAERDVTPPDLKLELVLDDPDETVIPLTEAEYLEANSQDDECVAALEKLKSGLETEVWMGGGAMPVTILRRAR